jgi:glutamate 5-kinase
MFTREELKRTKRIVVKVGTSTLTYASGKMNYSRLEKLVRELSDLKNQEREIILVTSGAAAVGISRMGLKEKPKEMPKKQALAAIGQGILMHIYTKLFSEYGHTAAQVLLTRENAVQHHQYINSRNALLTLLDMGVIPVINENDAVAVDEFKIGDNDTLSAMVATLVDADVLIILSDIDGVYTANPSADKNAKLIDEINKITPELEKIAGGAGSKLGTGGMFTKVQAAKIAINSGVAMVIASGAAEGVLSCILKGEKVGTLFTPKESHLRVRKRWLAFGKRIDGDIRVDDGCAKAMMEGGSSLLAAGITSVGGEFAAGSTVRVLTETGREFARGIVNYCASDIGLLRGKSTGEFYAVLGRACVDEIIHRDNMVMMV